jgi:hypothetical protein
MHKTKPVPADIDEHQAELMETGFRRFVDEASPTWPALFEPHAQTAPSGLIRYMASPPAVSTVSAGRRVSALAKAVVAEAVERSKVARRRVCFMISKDSF